MPAKSAHLQYSDAHLVVAQGDLFVDRKRHADAQSEAPVLKSTISIPSFQFLKIIIVSLNNLAKVELVAKKEKKTANNNEDGEN